MRFQALDEDVLVARGQGVHDVAATLAHATRATHSTWDRADPLPFGRVLAGRGARLARRAVQRSR